MILILIDKDRKDLLIMFNVNDILVGKTGYNCTLVEFYKVVRATKTTVMLQKMISEVTSHDGYGQAGYVVPSKQVSLEVPFRRKVKTTDHNKTNYVKISDYEYAYLWDGNEVAFDTYD